MNSNPEEIKKKLKEAEEKIENTLWEAVKDKNLDKELQAYKEVKNFLLPLTNLDDNLMKERNRILAYCLMRIDNTLVGLEDTDNSVERSKESFEFAEKSENIIQIARSSLAYGTRLLNAGQLPAAEKQFSLVIQLGNDHPDDEDIQQTVGWSLIVRGHILLGKSLYEQAIVVLEEAEGICNKIDNFAGIAQANAVLAQAYGSIGDKKRAEECKEKSEKFQEKAKEMRK